MMATLATSQIPSKETLGTTCQGCVQHSQKATLEGMWES